VNPDKAAHFAEDVSKHCRQLTDTDLAEHGRIKAVERTGPRPVKYHRDGKLVDEGYRSVGAAARDTA
jgi:hypothetical protein